MGDEHGLLRWNDTPGEYVADDTPSCEREGVGTTVSQPLHEQLEPLIAEYLATLDDTHEIDWTHTAYGFAFFELSSFRNWLDRQELVAALERGGVE